MSHVVVSTMTTTQEQNNVQQQIVVACDADNLTNVVNVTNHSIVATTSITVTAANLTNHIISSIVLDNS